jgi:hypothetical protein
MSVPHGELMLFKDSKSACVRDAKGKMRLKSSYRRLTVSGEDVMHCADISGRAAYLKECPLKVSKADSADEAKSSQKLATPAGFEPATHSLEGCCSIP